MCELQSLDDVVKYMVSVICIYKCVYVVLYEENTNINLYEVRKLAFI